MRYLREVHVNRLCCLLAIAFSIVACQHVGSSSGSAIEGYVADDIAVDSGTVKGKKISTLQDEEVELRGLVKSASNGSTIMYLSHDKSELEIDSYRNCINLIIDRKLRFNSPTVDDYIFTGKFIFIDRLDPSTVYLTYKNIRFDTDCQSFKRPDQYPYFVVKSFQKANER